MPGIFRSLTMRGTAGSITWGYRTAAVLSGWSLYRNEKDGWHLVASVDRADSFQLSRKPLRFNAPRPGGFFTFPILSVVLGRDHIKARLGHPEH